MELKEKLLLDVKEAMKSRNAQKLEVLRLLQSAFKNKEIECRPKEPTSNDYLSVLKKQAKQMQDSIDQYEKAGRSDLLEKEKKQLDIVKSYLPKLLSDKEVEQFVKEVVGKLENPSMKDIGAVMKELNEKLKGRADNKKVIELVRKNLAL